MNNIFNTTYDRNGSSVTTNALGMREMQQRIYEKYASQYLLLKAPPASGKSRALMFVAIEKFKQGLVKKVIVAVPERSIGKSFCSTKLKSKWFPLGLGDISEIRPMFARRRANEDKSVCCLYGG